MPIPVSYTHLSGYYIKSRIKFHSIYTLCFTNALMVPHNCPSDSPYGRMVYRPTEAGMIKVSA